ncbi:hypothetical protein NP233_g6581 [Leucocoprinus birnbaumii]|uniref:Protein kinase domain-containing protein n=1 Tax=Leucocoprinus birnbaumii TaxID=56174 RepID=A0AAD5VWC7_9AGAR|nr:hypothetical protein NP233_g6581 [Leucocoprinus birnbaumii]
MVEPLQYHSEPKASGGFGAVHQCIDPNLCVKVMRIDTKPRSFATWVKEVVLWAHASHPNLLPLTGMFFEQGDGTVSKICLVCPFLGNGNLCEYAPRIPQQDRFSLLLDVADGLQFLHIMGIVHSDLKGQNVLITSEYRAVITDFGSSRAISTTTTATTTTASTYTLCFAAPEVSLGGGKATTMADVWSFGCLIFQTLSRKSPYYQYSTPQLYATLLKRDPPLRPGLAITGTNANTDSESDSNSEEFSDEDEDDDWDPVDDDAWSLILRCCAPQPKDRLEVPEIQEAIKTLPCVRLSLLKNQLGDILQDPVSMKNLSKLKGTRAQTMIDYLYCLLADPLDKRTPRIQVFRLLYELCISSHQIPRFTGMLSSLELQFTSFDYYKSGYGLYTGKLAERNVWCISRSWNEVLEPLLQEILISQQLYHPNISYVAGMTDLDGGALIYPLSGEGLYDVSNLLDRDVLALRLPIFDLASGLTYLHNQGIVHGSLQKESISVNIHGRACIRGFDLAYFKSDKVAESKHVPEIMKQARESHYIFSDKPWVAPELRHEPEEWHGTAGDMWAFGILCFNIMRLENKADPITYSALVQTAASQIAEGVSPLTSEFLSHFDTRDQAILKLVDRCWHQDSDRRINAGEFLHGLRLAGISRKDQSEDEKTYKEERQFWARQREGGDNPMADVDLEDIGHIFDTLSQSIEPGEDAVNLSELLPWKGTHSSNQHYITSLLLLMAKRPHYSQ